MNALFQTLRADVFLQVAHLSSDCGNSLSEGEIIPFSGVSKSGAGCIAQAAGAGRSVRGTFCVELQPTLARSNIALKLIDSSFGISQFSCVFGIQCRNISLPGLHVFDGGVRQAEFLSHLITLLFEGDGVVAVMVNSPCHGYQEADNDSADDCG